MNLDSEDFNERENKKIKEFHNKRRSLIINLNNNYILNKKKEKKENEYEFEYDDNIFIKKLK